MTRSHAVLTSTLPLVLILGLWLWWTHPSPVDMAAYAPADSLLYLETNNPTAVVEALRNTDAWKIAFLGKERSQTTSSWFQEFVRWTGLGPTNSVIIARSQVAVVVTDLGVHEEGETLTVKPEVAVIIETHTSTRRVQAAAEQAIQKFAGKTYGQPTLRRTTVDGYEFLEWTAPDSSRQIVTTLIGSVVIIGNAERPVQKTLAVVLQRQPNLMNDAELRQLRRNLDRDRALAFGFVNSKSSPRLLSLMLPVLLGRAPDNAELGRLIDSSASKIIGSVGWSCRPWKTGIEDRYLVGVQPAIIEQLRDAFAAESSDAQSSAQLRDGIVSVSNYRFKHPADAWQGLRTAVSSHVDAVSAILFSSLLKSALLTYGISEPEKFLELVKSPIVTVRLEGSSNALLIAQAADESAIKDLLTKFMGYRQTDPGKPVANFINAESESSARIDNGLVMFGLREDLDRYAQLISNPATNAPRFDAASSDACVVTYADDSSRVKAFISTLLTAQGSAAQMSAEQERRINSLPYATTETVLVETGISRTTRSPLGQFSTILPLIFPMQPTATDQ